MKSRSDLLRPLLALFLFVLLGLMMLPHIAKAQTPGVEDTRRLAEQGHAAAQNNLGILYGLGQGVTRNLVNAHMWTNLSAAQGNPPALNARDAIARQMTPAQMGEAQRRASACLAANYRNC